MNLKELAKSKADQYWLESEDDHETWDTVVNNAYEKGFIDGFDHAKLLAAEIFKNCVTKYWGYTIPLAMEMLSKDIEDLGIDIKGE